MTGGLNYLPPAVIRPSAPVFVRTTPEPVYVETGPVRPDEKPAQIDRHDHVLALAAAHNARTAYPGPAGEILASEITAWKDLGCIGLPSAPVVRLIRELTRETHG